MLIRLILLLTVVPFVELTILLKLADRFSWQVTLGIVVLTGILGGILARLEGIKVLTRIRSEMASGIPPTGALVEGLLILVAGLVLVTPGVLTDACGFLLLVPPVRRFAANRLTAYFRRHLVVMHNRDDMATSPPPFVDVDVIDGDGTRESNGVQG